ncbi:DmsC/YnfH family molybdoenzyme membrane anchor subunit [Aestuariivirga sp.]|uniref:dimethyl sulfoxide reductase anchor subunit family protein n=1 Tax=Aestuariivirga sp. TaxID=2650926 RepID=UPI0025C003EB|nr:DmsC/YnfH family molybdoenzyme membrane anchor subunit [Aestuariivirga sp.]MCA3555677.1 dimethyl sulfoxide reductase anchor subunit [Aestuariivirga sp.]
MHPAYSVILFTTASGAGYGLLALLCLVGLSHGEASTLLFGLASMVIALGLITIGLLSSTLHLGHPERAWRAFSQWRSSWLSREGVLAVVTYVPAVLFGVVWSGLYPAPELIKPLAVITGALALLTVMSTGKIYATLKTIRAWHNPWTVWVYLAFALATGAAILAAITAVFGNFPAFLVYFASAWLVIALAVQLGYWRSIDAAPLDLTIEQATGLGRIGRVSQWEAPHTAANYVQTEMGYAVARRHAARLRRLVVIALVLAILLMLAGLVVPLAALPSAALAIFAAVVQRWLFFAEAQHVSTLFYGAEAA